jgi:hypothetical protein
MYQSVFYHRSSNTVHLWDDEKGYMRIPYRKYAYKNLNMERQLHWMDPE